MLHFCLFFLALKQPDYEIYIKFCNVRSAFQNAIYSACGLYILYLDGEVTLYSSYLEITGLICTS